MSFVSQLCPDCPLGREARAVIVSREVLPDLVAALAPLVLACALALVLVVWLERRAAGSRP